MLAGSSDKRLREIFDLGGRHPVPLTFTMHKRTGCLQHLALVVLSARSFASHEMKHATELAVGVSSTGFKFDCGRRR